jgi:hypothetical protein
VGFQRLEIIRQIGSAPIEPKLAAIGDQLPFAEGGGALPSPGSVAFFLSCTP